MKKLFFGLIFMALTAAADIEWQQDTVKLTVHPTQLSADAVFQFTNTGDTPAAISNVVVTCGCLSANPVKKSYAPGEKGELVVHFNLIGRTGEQRRYIVIESDDGQRKDLTVTADIPTAYEVETGLVLWKKDDQAKQKIIRLTNPNKKPIKLLSISSSLKDLPAELKTVREGFEYEVTIKRLSSDDQLRSVIRIATEPPPGMKESKTILLYAVTM